MKHTVSLLLLTLLVAGCAGSNSRGGSGASSALTGSGSSSTGTSSTSSSSTSTTGSSTTGTSTTGTSTTGGTPWQLTGIAVGGPYSAPPTPGSGTVTATTTPGVAILSLAVDPTAPTTLYAESYSSGSLALVKSTDGGATFGALTTTAGATPFQPGAVRVDASGNVFVSSDLGLTKSTDGGATWTLVFPATSGTFGSLVIVPATATTPATLYGLGDQLRASTDGGATWTKLNQPTSSTLSLLAADPALPTTLYGASNAVFAKGSPNGGGTTPSAGGFFKSTDGGLTWATLMNAQTDIYSSLTLDPTTTPTTVYAIDSTTSGGAPALLKSTDGGATFAHLPLPATPVPTGNFMLLVDSGTIYAAAVTAISTSTDGGATWFDASRGLGVDIVNQLSILVADPTSPAVLYTGGVQGGLWKTTTGGH